MGSAQPVAIKPSDEQAMRTQGVSSLTPTAHLCIVHYSRGRNETPRCPKPETTPCSPLPSMHSSYPAKYTDHCFCFYLQSSRQMQERGTTHESKQNPTPPPVCAVSWHRGSSGRRLCLFQSEDSHAAAGPRFTVQT